MRHGPFFQTKCFMFGKATIGQRHGWRVSKEMWSNNKQCHIRVHAQFISPQPKDELKLIAALQRFNL